MGWRRVRLIMALLVVGAGFGVAATAASAAVYEGRIKGQPNTSFDLTVQKAANGGRRVTRIDFNSIPAECENGPGPVSGYAEFFPPENRVRRDGSFEVEDDPPGPNVARVAGELQSGGKATGSYRQRIEFEGSELGVCNTGKLNWVANK